MFNNAFFLLVSFLVAAVKAACACTTYIITYIMVSCG